MTTLIIDGKTYKAATRDRNLLEVCLSLGLNVPYFCWHPALRSVGACRQCAVKVFANDKDTKGRIEMSCMTAVTEGMRVSIDDPEAVAFRAKVMEWLMMSHPHDCPICDEGGECHLQDMTVMTGHTYRKYRFKKQTFRNQDLGPFVNHEMNRCIECYRCVRFYRDYAGGRDLDVLGWHDHVYFGRAEDGALESEFSGNLVDVCPTGVFTDKSLKRHYTRKWDLQTAPSICAHCGLGCNTLPGARYGTLRRISPRYNGQVNGYFLCDRGRFGYAFVNSERRIREPSARVGGAVRPLGAEEAVAQAADHLRHGAAIGIGSPRASLEANFALRTLVGPERFFMGMPPAQARLNRAMRDILREGAARTPSLREVESADAVFVLGEDILDTAPMLELAVRQAILRKPREYARKIGVLPWDDGALRVAIQDMAGPLFVATVAPTKLDGRGVGIRGAPADLARLGFAVAHAIDPAAPTPASLSPEATAMAERIAAALKEAANPAIVSGPGAGSAEIVEAAANVAWALARTAGKGTLTYALPACNSLGLVLLDGGDAAGAVQAVAEGRADTLIVLENDLYRTLGAEVADALFSRVRRVVAIDHLRNGTTDRADVVLPAATFAEATGTFVNNEGRAQRSFQTLVPAGTVRAAWRWIGALIAARSGLDAAAAAGRPWASLDDVLADLARALPVFANVPGVAPPAAFRIGGQVLPRQPARYSGRTAMTAHLDVHEPQPPPDPDAPLSFSMEGYGGEPPAPLIPRFWAPGWNSSQAVNKFQIEVGGPLHGGDPGRRLIEPPAQARAPYFGAIPPAFTPAPDGLLVTPAWHIFGSEELSMLSPGVAERAPVLTLTVNPGDADRFALAAGEKAVLTLGETTLDPVLRVDAALPAGVATLSAGLPDQPPVELPAWGRPTRGGRP